MYSIVIQKDVTWQCATELEAIKGVTLCKHKWYQCCANKLFKYEFTDEMFLRPRSNDLFNSYSESSAHPEPFTSHPSPGSGKFQSVSELLRVFPTNVLLHVATAVRQINIFNSEKNCTINTKKESSFGVGVSEASVKVASDTLTSYRRKLQNS